MADDIIQQAFDAPTGTTVVDPAVQAAFDAPSAPDGSSSSSTDSTSWKVTVDGKDCSDKMNPYLISIEVQAKDGKTGDTSNLTFDDSNAQIEMPPKGALVQITLRGLQVFEGYTDELRSSGARGAGRIITVTSKSFNSAGKVKQPQDFHIDDKTLGDFLKKAAENAGLTITVDPAFADIKRDYWGADNESLLHLGNRLAQEYGATFKIQGTKAVFAQRGTGKTPSGATLPIIEGIVSDGTDGNLLAWDIAPYIGRPRHSKARGKHYDRPSATWKKVDVPIGEEPDSMTTPAHAHHDEDSATHSARGAKSHALRQAGDGSAKILLNPKAQVEGTFVIRGARPGIDGAYRIVGVTHTLNRSEGSLTTLELKQPGPDPERAPGTPVPSAAQSAVPLDHQGAEALAAGITPL